MNNQSVIICTFNPDPSIFEMCLSALREALKRVQALEIVVVDNNSTKPIQELDFVKEFLRWNAGAKLIIEKEQGLTAARLRAIKETTGELLVFIDDDNLLAPDFLEKAQLVAGNYPFIGAYSGQVELTYHKKPPEWTRKYWGMLVHRSFKGNHWGNIPFMNVIMPCGAGLCIRRDVANYYLALHMNGKRKFRLDRDRNSLMSGGDNDLAMCACDIGMGMGLFEDLHLRHFIPESRFTLAYFSRLTHGIYYSASVLKQMRTGEPETVSTKRTIWNQVRTLFLSKEDATINRAIYQGLKDAKSYLADQRFDRATNGGERN